MIMFQDLEFNDGRAEGESLPGPLFLPCGECGMESDVVRAIYGSVKQTAEGSRYQIHRDPIDYRREPCGHLLPRVVA